MKNVNLALRKAYVAALTGLQYGGKTIPVYEEEMQGTVATLADGTQAYIILLNQTSNNDSPKCVRTDFASIQIQITTVWPSNKGGSRVAQEISEVIMATLFPDKFYSTSIVLPSPFNMWQSFLESCRPIQYDTTTNRVWIEQMIMSHRISQG